MRQSHNPPSAGRGRSPSAQAPNPAETGGSLIGQVKLVVEQGRIIGEQYLLSEPSMLVGRIDLDTSVYPDIDLTGQDNDYVHRRHAQLRFYDLATHLSVEHLGGRNPTLVNNKPVASGELVELEPGDKLRVGRVVMRLVRIGPERR